MYWCQVKSQSRGLGWSRKKEFHCFARQGEPWQASALKVVWPTQERVLRSLVLEELDVISSWTLFWLAGGEVRGSQHPQPSVLIHLGSVCFGEAVNFFHLVEAEKHLQNSSKDISQNVMYSPWGRNEGPYLCLMAKVLSFHLAWLFCSFCIFSQVYFWLMFFYRQKEGEGCGWESSKMVP